MPRFVPPMRPYSFPIRDNEWGGLYCGGINGYVNAGHKTSLDITSAITIEAWVNPRGDYTTLSYPAIVRKESTYALRFSHLNGALQMYIWIGASAKASPLVYGAWVPGVWTHFVGVYNGANISIYKNGVLNGTPTVQAGAIDTTANDLGIGAVGSGGSVFRGAIGEVSIWNRALSVSEIILSYEGRLLPDNTCVLWHDYRLGHAQDLSGNGNHGTLTGGVSWV